MEKFEKGDIVQLKSGGPKMTVEKVNSLGVHCKWFAGSKLSHDYFEPYTLDKVEKKEKP